MRFSDISKTFQARVTILLVGLMLFVAIVGNLFVYTFAIDSQFQQLRDKVRIIARIAALRVDPREVLGVPRNRSGVNAGSYLSIASKLVPIQQNNPAIDSIYILSPTDKHGVWEFVFDSDPLARRGLGITSFPGDKYNAARFPQMMKGLDGASADKKIERDEWGDMLSGYAPIRDAEGRTLAVLGVDIKAEEVFAAQAGIRRRVALVIVGGLVLALLLGSFFSRQIVRPVRELSRAAARLGEGDLDHRVVGGDYGSEISELTATFNRMADCLQQAQHKSQSYFYRVIQSLVRIVEAKDYYTRGHSERVAGYAARIASQMGFSSSEIDELKSVAVLHDIGKLGIHDDILNKKDPLTDEEWEVIRQHPVLGEEILKPLCIDEKMVALVRAHHERYDGAGYPDGLKGEQINVFAQILSVADAYDAMTSQRAYRSPMTREEAMAEIRQGRSSQFHPRVVDAFLDVLREESIRA
ncbi:MAG: HD domain-containing protein [Elusimicrobia bacterium]|nr:HD domain-containing protein [Elusimicrobiota bacterium]